MAQYDQNNKVIAAIAVFPVFFIIYFIAGKGSDYVKYCANQGLAFTLIGIIVSVAAKIIGIIPLIGFLFGIIFWAIDVAMLILIIYQAYNAYKGTIKPIPIIGDITIIK